MKAKQYIKGMIMGAVCVLLMQTALASEPEHYDRVTLSAEATEEVANDTLVAILYAQREGSELAQLADEINKSITQAVNRGKKLLDVEVQTQAYQTYPIYQQQRLSGWRVRQSIQLKSRNIKVLSGLIGELQNTLAVESINYMVSHDQRIKMEDVLIGKAIAAFQQRAQQITRHLGRKKHRLVHMDVQRSGTVQPMLQRSFSPMLESKVAAPSVEPGKQSLTVTVSGVIELLVD
jgi:predicted secreted protein